MKNISFGFCSSVVAALVWVGYCGTIAVVGANQLFFFKHPVGELILGLIVYLGFPTSLGLALLGVGLARGGLMQANRKRTPAVAGLVLNGLFLLGVLGLFCEFGANVANPSIPRAHLARVSRLLT